MNVVWFKRDLRLTDHQPLKLACQQPEPLALLYIFEPSLLSDSHYDLRHWRFVWESLMAMQQVLTGHDAHLHIIKGEADEVLADLHRQTPIKTLYSHQEIGIFRTFERDLGISDWCKSEGIVWQESPSGVVLRGLRERINWDKHWERVMRAELEHPALDKPTYHHMADCPEFQPPKNWQSPAEGFQKGGWDQARKYLHSFFQARGKNYQKHISKPEQSRRSCSRLSPYLAWGNISLREAYHTLLAHWNEPGWRRALIAFSSRLHWHCHFIQKFESEYQMEFRPINRGYEGFPHREDSRVAADLEAWKAGKTGYPMIDACMRCLVKTGYINFRMRSMLVSFLCHHLMIDWRLGVHFLARQFLDFEPGIHYAQFQMQAGMTGMNTVRIYNPTKQAADHDPEGAFIHKWVRELRSLPAPLVFQPHTMTLMEMRMYGFEIGKDYPEPIVDIQVTGRQARQLFWSWRNKPAVKKEGARILKRHVRPKSGRQPKKVAAKV